MRGIGDIADTVAIGPTVKRMKPNQDLIQPNGIIAGRMKDHTERKRRSGEKNVRDIKAPELMRTIQD